MNKVVSIVVSTRKIDEKYVSHVKKMFSHPKVQLLFYENNGEHSLTEIYNKGLKESVNDIVVFMHDDLIFGTKNMNEKIIRMFERNPDFGIIGVAGTTNLLSGWWWEDNTSSVGHVYHIQKNGKKTLSKFSKESYPDVPREVACVDGLFIVVDKNKIKESFDERFKGFHHYDISFCISNKIKDVKIGVTTKFDITHKSIGMINEQWKQNKELFESIYGIYLPIKI
jgi:hypothetical protein